MKRIWLTFYLLTTLSSLGWSSVLPNQSTQFKRTHYAQKAPEKKKDTPEPNIDGVVEVSFRIDAQGKLQIITIDATNPQLADYVLKKLGKVQISQSDAQIGKVVKYSFVFKKQA